MSEPSVRIEILTPDAVYDLLHALDIGIAVTGGVSAEERPCFSRDLRVYTEDGGHGFLFTTFDGELMMVLHSPNSPASVTRPRIFQLEDTGQTLRLVEEFTGVSKHY